LGLVLQYVKQTKSGGFHYRRRVPQDIEELIGKREFNSVLGSSRAEACATNVSTKRSSTAWPMLAELWPSGATITTISGRIHRWATRPLQKRAGRLSNLRTPRSARLPNSKPTAIKPKDSRYERGTTGGQVKRTRFGTRIPVYNTLQKPVMARWRLFYKLAQHIN
jgi:hypothetical protein